MERQDRYRNIRFTPSRSNDMDSPFYRTMTTVFFMLAAYGIYVSGVIAQHLPM